MEMTGGTHALRADGLAGEFVAGQAARAVEVETKDVRPESGQQSTALFIPALVTGEKLGGEELAEGGLAAKLVHQLPMFLAEDAAEVRCEEAEAVQRGRPLLPVSKVEDAQEVPARTPDELLE